MSGPRRACGAAARVARAGRRETAAGPFAESERLPIEEFAQIGDSGRTSFSLWGQYVNDATKNDGSIDRRFTAK